MVRIALGDDERLPWLREHLGPDPRIRIAPRQSALDEFPAAAFHVEIPATVRIAPDMVRRMRAELGSAASAVAHLGDRSTASITRAWALHRARRNGSELDRFGEVLLLSPRRFGIALAAQRGGREPRWRHLRRRIAQVRVKIGQVRFAQTGMVVFWLGWPARCAGGSRGGNCSAGEDRLRQNQPGRHGALLSWAFTSQPKALPRRQCSEHAPSEKTRKWTSC